MKYIEDRIIKKYPFIKEATVAPINTFTLDGGVMTGHDEIIREIYKKLDLRGSFNYDALEELLSEDLWVDTDNLDLFIENFKLLLKNNSKHDLTVLFDIFDRKHGEWSKRNKDSHFNVYI